MPTYDYRCNSCEGTLELFLSIANRNKPTEEPCPSCNANTVVRVMTKTPIIAGVGEIYSKTPDGFKDVLKEMHKNSGRFSKIDV